MRFPHHTAFFVVKEQPRWPVCCNQLLHEKSSPAKERSSKGFTETSKFLTDTLQAEPKQ